ncbi:MAG: hypothetical protein IT450_18685 [Phycisphaerales bacterium]|nr:hypothetical protein [Phycisphaerales bacterium]
MRPPLTLAQADEIPEWFGAIDWADHTTVHPVGLAIVLAAGVALLFVPRRWAFYPIAVVACFVSMAQRIVVLGLDFTFLRVIVAFGLLRVVVRGEAARVRWEPLDTAVVAWALTSAAVTIFRVGDSNTLVNRAGFCFDSLGAYFVARFLIVSVDDYIGQIRAWAVLSIPVALAFLNENATQRNLFAVFGGVPEFTVIREERLRCQGAFAHAIVAGGFWVSLMPLFASLAFRGRTLCAMGFLALSASLTITVCCASSTPIASLMVGLACAMLFPFRRSLSAFRVALVVLLFALHVMMKKPVWHLLARVDFVGGSTGYHRYELIDGFIQHFDEWWFIGTQRTYHWSPWGMFDITNQFVWEGIMGGLAGLILFILVLYHAFGAVGRFLHVAEGDSPRVALAWCLGVALVVHCANFFGISYFGQITFIWYFLLAGIASCSAIARGSAGRATSIDCSALGRFEHGLVSAQVADRQR